MWPLRFQFSRGGWTTSGLHWVLLAGAWVFDSPVVGQLCLLAMALLSVWAWLALLSRIRLLRDTPRAMVASAPQGYVKLQGRGQPLGGVPVRLPLTGLPCLWYRLHTMRKEDDRWVYESSDESSASFLLQDESGACLVDPEGADMVVARQQTWDEGDHRYTLWVILANDAIHAMGILQTDSTSHVDIQVSQAVADLLVQWKEDRPTLLRRFDLNGDGQVDMEEWALARAQAQREVAQARRQAVMDHRDLHMLGSPTDGRPYLITTAPPEQWARRYVIWAWLQGGAFLVALTGMAALVRH